MRWNKCDECGKFINYQDIAEGKATHKLLNPTEYGADEEYETLCKVHITRQASDEAVNGKEQG